MLRSTVLLFLCFAGLVTGIVTDVLVVHIDLLELVQFSHARLHFALHHFEKVQVLKKNKKTRQIIKTLF